MQPKNAFALILVTEAGIIIEVKPEQLWNTDAPILVKLLLGSNVMEVKLVQLLNASPLILLTLLGIVILNKLVQLSNNWLIIVINNGLVGKVTVANLKQL